MFPFAVTFYPASYIHLTFGQEHLQINRIIQSSIQSWLNLSVATMEHPFSSFAWPLISHCFLLLTTSLYKNGQEGPPKMHQKISFQSGQKYLVQFGKCKNQDGQVKSGRDGWLELLDHLPLQSPLTQQQRCKSANVHPASFPFGSRIMTPYDNAFFNCF